VQFGLSSSSAEARSTGSAARTPAHTVTRTPLARCYILPVPMERLISGIDTTATATTAATTATLISVDTVVRPLLVLLILGGIARTSRPRRKSTR